MTKLEQLIQEKCPNGVEYRTLDEIAIMFSGMTGVSKKWADDGNCKFIDYMNAYKNMKIDVSNLQNATVKKLDQNCLQKGDILCTSASETPDECAISSVIEDDIENNVFLDDHLFGVRFKDEYKTKIDPTFINYYLHTDECRKKINKTVRGVTRFYISNNDFAKLQLPVPPLEVQREIVEILDKFTLLTAELTAELTARKEQLKTYKDKLLKANTDVEFFCLNDLTEKCSNIKWQNDDIKEYIDLSSVNRENSKIETTTTITKDNHPSRAQQLIKENDILFGTTRPLLKRYTFINKEYDNQICSTGYCVLRANASKVIPKWIYYQIQLDDFYKHIENYQIEGGYPSITDGNLKKYTIPVPSLEYQQKTINILDKFDDLCNDITSGLPAEIEARKKQYEYFRDKLMTFKRLEI